MLKTTRSGAIDMLKSSLFASGGSIASMAFAAIGGILLVRFLDPTDYARYVLVFGIYQTVQMLADMGTSSGAYNEARKNWQSKDAVGAAIRAAEIVRRPIQIVVFTAAFFVTLILTIRHGASVYKAICLAALIVASAIIVNRSTLKNIPLYLHQKVKELQIATLSGDALRFVGVIGIVYFLRDDLVAMALVSLGFLIRNLLLAHFSHGEITFTEQPSQELIDRVKNFNRKIRPVWIYACFADSISLYLASAFGKTMDLAAVGGLGRIAVLIGVGGYVFGGVVAPRFARENRPGHVIQKFWLCVAILAIVNVGAATPFILFPDLALILLGKNYSGFGMELRIICIGAALGGIYSGVYALGVSRGFLVPAWKYLGCIFVWQILLFNTFSVSSLQGILWIGALTPVPSILGYLWASVKGLKAQEIIQTNS